MGRREERLYRRDSCSEWDRGRGDGCGTGGAATTVFLSGERNIYTSNRYVHETRVFGLLSTVHYPQADQQLQQVRSNYRDTCQAHVLNDLRLNTLTHL